MIFDPIIHRAERSFDGETRRKRGVSLAGYCARFKGDDPVNETQSTSNANQTDQRVGASDSAVAVGPGGFLDQSFTDQSETTLNTIDQSDHSLRQAFTDSHNFTDNSQTTLNTSDNRDQSVKNYDQRDLSTYFQDNSQTTLNTYDQRDESDRRVFTDNSQTTITTLDAELAKTALNSTSTLAGKAIDTVAANSKAGFAFAGAGIETAFATAQKLAEASLADSAALRAEQTSFLSQFYQDRAGTDAKASGDLIKYGAGVAALGLALIIIKGRKAA